MIVVDLKPFHTIVSTLQACFNYRHVTFSSDYWTVSLHSLLSSLIAICFPLITCRYIGLPLFSLLSLIPPYLRSTLTLSSGALFIPLSVAVPLSPCTIHRLTKRWYSRPWTMSPSPYYFTRSSPLAVYKDVLVAA